jgi:peptidoglycan hydrolase CwlO-like protein
MNICSRYHTEVVFETRECPMCLLMKELDKRAVDVGKLNESIESNEEERKELEADMERLREKLTQAEKDLELTRNGQLDGQR